MQVKKNNRAYFLLLLVCAGLAAAFFPKGTKTCALKVERRASKGGRHYTIFRQGALRADFVLQRPSKNDTSILLCIPAAFTALEDYSVDGVHISQGKIYKKNKVNRSIGGAVMIVDGKATLFSTKKGALLTDSLLNKIAGKKGALFQQIMIVQKSAAPSFKDSSYFQRRAIVDFGKGKIAVVESGESIRLAEFARDLVELGALHAIYTDMGAWDEGWYRDPGDCKAATIGLLRSQTEKQTNWFVFKK